MLVLDNSVSGKYPAHGVPPERQATPRGWLGKRGQTRKTFDRIPASAMS